MSIDKAVPDLVSSDGGRISQVLNNLVCNAIKYTEDGRVGLQVSELAREDDGAVIRFAISDSGGGIEPSQLEQLFKPFTQINGSGYSSKDGGWGLGLAICSQIADLMGGKIQVESEPGSGSTFFFEVPVKILSN